MPIRILHCSLWTFLLVLVGSTLLFSKRSGSWTVLIWNHFKPTAKCTGIGRWREQGQRIFRWCVLATLLSVAGLALGQPNLGMPSFSAFDAHEVDTVNLQNLNVTLNTPVYSKAGAIPFNYGMFGNYSVGVSDGQFSISPGL